jgi:hypothetical protein
MTRRHNTQSTPIHTPPTHIKHNTPSTLTLFGFVHPIHPSTDLIPAIEIGVDRRIVTQNATTKAGGGQSVVGRRTERCGGAMRTRLL